MTPEEYVGIARSEDPTGTICGHCGLTNYFADDIGWYMFGGKIGCEKCWEGSIGQEHRDKYGTGER